jgi:hypothetical protein
MAQTEHQHTKVMRDTLQAIDEVLRPLMDSDSLHCKEPALVKKMTKLVLSGDCQNGLNLPH